MPMSNENWLKPEVVEQATAAPGEQRELPIKSSDWFTREIAESLGLNLEEVISFQINGGVNEMLRVSVTKYVGPRG